MITENDMGEMISAFNPSAFGWGVLLFSLGVLILATSILSISVFKMKKMRSFGAIMEIYGIAMFVIGFFMYSGLTPMMTGQTLSSVGMFAIGALMVINAGLMFRTVPKIAVPEMGHSAGQQRQHNLAS